MEAPTLFVAFIAGLLSFLSPCVLPLVPAYIGYMSGATVMSARGGGTATMSSSAARTIALTHALLFVLGFTIVFAMIGRLVGEFSTLLAQNRSLIQIIMGILLIVFGLHMIGLINISFLNYTRRLDYRPSSSLGYLRSFLIGLGFGVGWTPCIGPTLGLIFTLAIQGQQSQAIIPFVAYSIGLGIPFLVTALAMGQISAGLKKITRRSYSFKLGSWTLIDHVNIVSAISGVLLIVMGILVTTNSLTLLTPATTWFNV